MYNTNKYWISEKDKKKRLAEMLYLYMEELWTLEKIGERFKVSRERIRQLLNKTGKYVQHYKLPKKQYEASCKNPECKNIIVSIGKFPRKFCEPKCRLRLNKIGREKLIKSGVVFCHKCQTKKPVSEFYKHYKNKDRTDIFYSSPCKECHEKIVNSWAARHPEKAKEIQKRATDAYYQRAKSSPEKWNKLVERQRLHYRKMVARIKKDPVRYAAWRKGINDRRAKYLEKLMEDPVRRKEYYRKQRVKQSKRYWEIRGNPVLWKKHQEKQRLWHQRKKLEV